MRTMISQVQPSSDVIAIPSMSGRTRAVLLTGFCTVVAVIPAFGSPTQNWLVSQRAAYLAAVASVAALLIYRGWHTGVRFDIHGLTIRYFFWTRRIGWQEVSRFADGLTAGLGEGAGLVWTLVVVLRNGRVVKVKATARDGSSAEPKVLTAVLQAAQRYGVPAALTGVASKRRAGASAEEYPSEPAPSPEAGGIVLGEWAVSRDFSTSRLRPGYDIEEVDAFVESIRQAFLGIGQPPLTADEVRDKRFSTTRLRPGYDQEEVDAFLDAAELRLAAVTRPEGHGGLPAVARCPECGMETADPTRPCARCGAPAAWQPSLAGPAASQQAEDAWPGDQDPPRGDRRDGWRGSGHIAINGAAPIRREVALAGAGTALLAGAAGLVSGLLLYTSYDPGVYFFGLAAYLASTGVAVAALRRIDRPVITGLLQGMCWPAVVYVAADIAMSAADHMFGLTGLYLAALWVGVLSDVLGAGAAVLLLISWSPAAGWHRGSRLRPLAVMLLCGVGLSRIVGLISAFTQQGKNGTSETFAVAGLLVGLAVTWYAVNLQAHALGGALVLGWSTVTALWLVAGMSPPTAMDALGCVLLAAVIVMTLIYMRMPDTPASERSAFWIDQGHM
jgi:DivIVA domain-containing protein